MASVQPTPAEAQGMRTLDDVLKWAGLEGNPEEPTSPAGSLLALLGASTSTPVRLVAMINEADYTQILSEWKINGSSPTPMQASLGQLVGLAARIAGGTQVSDAEKAKQIPQQKEYDVKLLELQSQAASLQGTAGQSGNNSPRAQNTGSTPQSSTVSGKKLEMSTVANQTDDSEVEVLDEAKVVQYYKNYTDTFESLPPPDEEPTSEQLTELHQLLLSDDPPYVDFCNLRPSRVQTDEEIENAGPPDNGRR